MVQVQCLGFRVALSMLRVLVKRQGFCLAAAHGECQGVRGVSGLWRPLEPRLRGLGFRVWGTLKGAGGGDGMGVIMA